MRLEKELRASINALLHPTIHRQSMTGAAMTCNGVPDFYYDGSKADLWVEYKLLKGIPRDGIVRGEYTALQLRWMERRYRVGKNMVGIVGLPNRTAVIQATPLEWGEGSPIVNAMTLKEVACWIESFVGNLRSQVYR